MAEYRSRKRVHEKDEQGVLRLKYAEGDPIPEAEARRQGLLKPKPATKARKRPKGTPAI